MGIKDVASARYKWVILLINAFICALAYSGLTTWTMALPSLTETFKISGATASLGSSVFMAGYAVGSFVEAHVAAKKGYRTAGLLGLSFMVIGLFGVTIAPNFALVLLFRFMQGWGILWLVGVNSSVAWFPPAKRGFASGVIGASLTLGIGMGGLVATGLMSIAGTWQGAFRIFAVILLISSILWGILMKTPPKGLYAEDIIDPDISNIKETKKTVNIYKTPAVWLCVAVLFFNAWALIGFNTISSPYILSLGYTEVQAGLVVLFSGLIGVISTVLGGAISDVLVKKGTVPLKARALTQAIPGFGVAAITLFIYPAIAPISFSIALIGSVLVGWESL